MASMKTGPSKMVPSTGRDWFVMIVIVVFPLIVGTLSSLTTRKAMLHFNEMSKPPLSPPAWLFPVVWTILYLLMGISFYLIFSKRLNNTDYSIAIFLFILQLLLNSIWSPIFFNRQFYLTSLVILLSMWVLILFMMMYFFTISRIAALLIVPYFFWCTFAAYLNAAFAYLAKRPLPL